MGRRSAFCIVCLTLIFFVFPFIADSAPATNKAKQKKSTITAKQNKSSRSSKQSVKADRRQASKKKLNTRAIRAQVREPEVDISESESEFIEYQVKRGDTLEKIASQFNVEKDELIETNDLVSKKNRKLAPGKTILIPKALEEDSDVEENIVTFKSIPVKPWKNNDEKYMLVKVAKSFMGAPYKYGGNTVRGLDCSAYVKKIYEIFDVQLPRSAREQYHVGAKVGRNDLVTGDLVFFKTRRYAKYPTHVGIYIGDGNFIHASSGKGRLGVKIDSLSSDYYSGAYIGATRVRGNNAENMSQGTNPAESSEKKASNNS